MNEENKQDLEQTETEQIKPEQSEQPEELTEKQKLDKRFESFSILQDFVYLLSVITIIFVFFFRTVGVDGSSMFPTFVDKDYLILESNFLYKDVRQGDIVVLSVDAFKNRGPIVKRVIATGGQTVDIDFTQGIVYVDGVQLEENYTFEPTYESYAEYGLGLTYPVTVPEGQVFVMGDNRNNSADSRYAPVGCTDESRILGKVLFLVFPGAQTNEQGEVVGGRDFSRIGVVK